MQQMTITSTAFGQEEMIPVRYTCDGDDLSPPLQWSGFPEGTKSFTLICEDPDAPMGTFDHWILANIPSEVTELPEGFTLENTGIEGLAGGINSFRKLNYGGPCPPGGTHRYYFRIYALDTELNVMEGADKEDVLKAMEGHILAKGELMGKYKRQ